VLPPYWAVTACTLALFVALSVLTGDADKIPGAATVVKSLLMIPMPPRDYVLLVAWTLSLEALFYGVFAATALTFGRASFFAALGAWYLASLVAIIWTGDMSGWAIPALNPVVLEFMFGSLVAVAVLAKVTPFRMVALALGIVGIAAGLTDVIGASGWARREFLYGIPALLLVYGATGVNIRWPKLVLLLGEPSYLLYLIHIIAFMAIARAVYIATGFNVYSTLTSAVATIIATICLSCALTVYVERPYQTAYKSLRIAIKRRTT
jgi:exopolysaccharide production protein ExoZ